MRESKSLCLNSGYAQKWNGERGIRTPNPKERIYSPPRLASSLSPDNQRNYYIMKNKISTSLLNYSFQSIFQGMLRFFVKTITFIPLWRKLLFSSAISPINFLPITRYNHRSCLFQLLLLELIIWISIFYLLLIP